MKIKDKYYINITAYQRGKVVTLVSINVNIFHQIQKKRKILILIQETKTDLSIAMMGYCVDERVVHC